MLISYALFTVFLEQNPLPYLARYPEADVLTSSDLVVPTVADDRLDIWQQGEDFIEKHLSFVLLVEASEIILNLYTCIRCLLLFDVEDSVNTCTRSCDMKLFRA